MRATTSCAADDSCPSRTCRVTFPGQNVRAARLLEVPFPASAPLKGEAVLRVLAASNIAGMADEPPRWQPLIYDSERCGWASLLPDTVIAGDGPVNVLMEDASFSPHWQQAAGLKSDEAHNEGYFGVGVVQGKTAGNQGTVWRSAYQLGAAFTFTIGQRFESSKIDTSRCWAHLPAFSFESVEAFACAAPFGAQWVAVEMGGVPLTSFVHPQRAVYILGSEDSGVPSALLKHAHHRVSIPAARTASFNVAVAASIVLYDRHVKQHTAPVPRLFASFGAEGPPPPHTRALPPAQPPPVAQPLPPLLPTTAAALTAAAHVASGVHEPPDQPSPPRGAPSAPLLQLPTPGELGDVPGWARLTNWWEVHAHRLPEGQTPPIGSSGGPVVSVLDAPLLAIRAAPAYRSRLAEYLHSTYGATVVAANRILVLARAAAGTHAAALYRRIRADVTLRRVLEGVYLASACCDGADTLAALTMRALGPTVDRNAAGEMAEGAAEAEVNVRLHVFPRSLHAAVEGALDGHVPLSPSRPTHHLFGVGVGDSSSGVLHALVPSTELRPRADGSEGAEAEAAADDGPSSPPAVNSLIAEAMRRGLIPASLLAAGGSPPDCAKSGLPPKVPVAPPSVLLVHDRARGTAEHPCAAFLRTVCRSTVRCIIPEGQALLMPTSLPEEGRRPSVCLVDINAEAGRLLPLLVDWVVPQVDGIALVRVQQPRKGDADHRAAVMKHAEERLRAAGCTDVSTQWLFANSVCERTLVFTVRQPLMRH